jgi:hypothetical protein
MLGAERDISAPKTRLIQIKAGNFAPGMKAKDHIVVRRPILCRMTKHPTTEFAGYERRLESMRLLCIDTANLSQDA